MPNKQFNSVSGKMALGPGSVEDRLKDPFVGLKFTELSDTFVSYAGHAGKFLIVETDLTGIGVSAIAITSDTDFAFSQLTDALEWLIPHNLNKYPEVRIFKDGREIEGEIQYVDENNIAVRFDIAITGIVYCN